MSKMLDGSLRIPEGEERMEGALKTKDLPLISEMMKLQATSHSKYLIDVKAPEIKGMHDDMSDAYARSVFLATEYMNAGGNVIKQNSVETTGPSGSYKQYFRKSKMNAFYTKRPSSAVMSDLSRGRSISNNFPGRGR